MNGYQRLRAERDQARKAHAEALQVIADLM